MKDQMAKMLEEFNEDKERRLEDRLDQIKEETQKQAESPALHKSAFCPSDYVTHGQFHEFKKEYIDLRKSVRDMRSKYFDSQTKDPSFDPLSKRNRLSGEAA